MKFLIRALTISLAVIFLFSSCENNEGLDQETEICDNNIDDDGDGLIDCADDDCQTFFDCLAGSEICDNNIDDDGDGLIDCADENCLGHPSCPELGSEICNNNIDDDGDGLIDCEDSDCENFIDCSATFGWVEVASFNAGIYDLKVYDDKLFVAGNFTKRNDQTCYWSTILSNNSFSNHTNAIGGSGINELAIFDDKMYGVGALSQPFSNVGVVTWNGTTWDISGPSNANVSHSSIYADDTTLYVGSDFGVVSHRTVDAQFEQYPTLDDEGSVLSITKFNGSLIIAGDFGGRIARWDGNDWEALGGGIPQRTVRKILVYNDQLIAAGNFTEIGGQNIRGIASWDGSAWSDLGGSLPSSSDGIQDMVVHNNDLYVVGNFKEIGGTLANYVARWNGTAWESLNLIDQMEFLSTVEVYNNRLYFGTVDFPEARLYRLDL